MSQHMNSSSIRNVSRRVFLARAGALGGMGLAAPMAMSLAAAGDAAAFSASDYKALVCVFLYGGNDCHNTLIPADIPNYDRYSAIRGGASGRKRGGIAYGLDELVSLRPSVNQTLTDELSYGLAPSLSKTGALFNSGKLAIQLNVGPLVVPLTRVQFQSGALPLPPKLFSHNDQQSVWQALGAEGATVGWGGRMGDLALSSNTNSLLTCISASGNAVFLSGNDALQYQISPGGAIPIWAAKGASFGSSRASEVLKTLITEPRAHVLENEFTRVTKRSMVMEDIVNTALSPVTLTTSFDTDNKPNSLANQLKIVARLIGARNALGSKRQVFFVSLGGFDTHDGLMETHPNLLALLDEALSSFYAATVEMGVENQVTTFTASDFGRTLTSNGDGSDHGWGGHHFVMGGAVKGGRYFGTAPQVSVTSDDQVGQGRLLPSTSVDQMASTFARWFGASENELSTILPRITNFSSSDLGYFSA